MLALALGGFAGCGGGGGQKPTTTATPAVIDSAFLLRMLALDDALLRADAAAVKHARISQVRSAARAARPALRAERAALVSARKDFPGAVTGGYDFGLSLNDTGENVQPQALAAARPFDALYVGLAQRLQQGVLRLAQAEIKRGREPSVRALAGRIGVTHARQLNRLQESALALSRSRTP